MLSAAIAESQTRDPHACTERLAGTKTMLRVPWATIAIVTLSSQVWAQATTPTDSQAIAALVQQVKDLQQETVELRQRVKTLETEKASTPSTQNASALDAPPPTPASISTEPSSEAASALHEFRGIQ